MPIELLLLLLLLLLLRILRILLPLLLLLLLLQAVVATTVVGIADINPDDSNPENCPPNCKRSTPASAVFPLTRVLSNVVNVQEHAQMVQVRVRVRV